MDQQIPIVPMLGPWCQKCNQLMDTNEKYTDPHFGKVVVYKCSKCGKTEKIY